VGSEYVVLSICKFLVYECAFDCEGISVYAIWKKMISVLHSSNFIRLLTCCCTYINTCKSVLLYL
jgi:hypothetical protein